MVWGYDQEQIKFLEEYFQEFIFVRQVLYFESFWSFENSVICGGLSF